jgi:Ribonuclease toxin, BrnT, of type II toxin-antitoxin system
LALEFEWDPRKNAANLEKHGVSFEEAASVFGDPLGRIVSDPRHSQDESGSSYSAFQISSACWQSCSQTAEKRFGLLARDERHARNEEIMQKALTKRPAANRTAIDEILPEYDFSKSRRNKYASRYAPGSVVVMLDPDVAALFGSSKEANDALRALAGIIKKRRPRRASSK